MELIWKSVKPAGLTIRKKNCYHHWLGTILVQSSPRIASRSLFRGWVRYQLGRWRGSKEPPLSSRFQLNENDATSHFAYLQKPIGNLAPVSLWEKGWGWFRKIEKKERTLFSESVTRSVLLQLFEKVKARCWLRFWTAFRASDSLSLCRSGTAHPLL